MLVYCHVVLIAGLCIPYVFFSLYFNQNESDFSEEETFDDVCDPEYVPGSESETEDEEQINSLANSTFQVAEESLMDTSMNCNVTDDTVDTGQSCTNTVPSTSVVRAGQNFCFICKDFHFKIARHFKTHIKENSPTRASHLERVRATHSGKVERKEKETVLWHPCVRASMRTVTRITSVVR